MVTSTKWPEWLGFPGLYAGQQARFEFDLSPPCLLQQNEFEICVARELRRTERSQQGLMLALVGVAASGSSDRAKLATILSGRMRATDYIGWYDRNTLGVLFTEIHAAKREAISDMLHSRIVKSLPDHIPVSICPKVPGATAPKEIRAKCG